MLPVTHPRSDRKSVHFDVLTRRLSVRERHEEVAWDDRVLRHGSRRMSYDTPRGDSWKESPRNFREKFFERP